MFTENLGSMLAAKYGTIQSYQVGAGVHIYIGATVVVRLTTGYAHQAIDDTADMYKQVVVGHAAEEIDNSAGIAGALNVRVRIDGKLKRSFPGAAQADIGKLACVKDDETIQLYGAGTTKAVVGRITEVADLGSSVYVNFADRPARLATSLYD